ncbi:hypothetical protein N2E09_04550 [Leuconostoc citreum]
MIVWNKDRPLIQEGVSALGILPKGIYAAPDGDKNSARLLVAADGIHLTQSDFSDLEINEITLQSSTNKKKFIIGIDDDGQLLIDNNVYEPTSNELAIAKETAQKALDGLKDKVSQSDYDQKADSISQTVAQVSGKVDNLKVGGRNYVKSSSGINASDNNRPNINGVDNTGVYNNQGNLYTPDGLFMQIKDVHAEMFYSLINAWTNLSDVPQLKAGNTYTVSCEVVGSFDYVAFRISDVWYEPIPLNHTVATKVSQTFTIPADATKIYIRLNASNGKSGDTNFFNEQAIIAKGFKLEDGNLPTAWTPAPEDVDNKFSTQQQTIDSLVTEIKTLKASMDNAVFIKH